jgi:hypothetical protein
MMALMFWGVGSGGWGVKVWGKRAVVGGERDQLGRQAGQQRLSDGLHNSRQSSPRTSQEGAEYDVVPDSEFTVARTATRANTSDYYVNGKKQSVKEVGF